MNFTVERDFFASAVTWVARSLPGRPITPVLAGVVLELVPDTAERSRLSIAGFDYETSTRVARDVDGSGEGRILVSGRMLADIAKALPRADPLVRVEQTDAARATLTCGSSRFVLPLLKVEEYPDLPDLPEAIGTVESDVLEQAVSQVAVAAGREDALAVLTGVRIEVDGDRLTLAATDRYRLAVRELAWRPRIPGLQAHALVPARTLVEAARSMLDARGDGPPEALVHLTGGGEGGGRQTLFGLSSGGRQMTTHLLDGEFPKYRSLLPAGHEATAELPRAELSEAVRRVALVAERNSPVRLTFSGSELVLQASGIDDAAAEESLGVEFSGDELTIAFNPTYLLDGLSALETDTVQLGFTAATRPALLTAKGEGTLSDYRYLIMPVRLPG